MPVSDMTRQASQSMDIPDSPVGYHCLNVPSWVSSPPIEAVVFAWGASEDHQLGLDTEDNIDCPKVVESLLGLKFMGRSFVGCPLIGGSRNTLAIDADGCLWSWGWNDRGTLGHGHRELQRKPAQIEALAGVKMVQAAIGGWHCLALSAEGQVYCWGGNEYQQCGYVAPEDEQEQQQQQWRISHTTKSDTGQQSGVNGDGNNAAADGYGTPEGGDRRVNGHTFSSGGSSMGVLPRARDILVPRRCMPDLRVKQVACGGMNSVVLTDVGEVWTWGEPWGEFALELQRAPRKVPGATNIAAIACGAFHNMALIADGRVLSWGTNDYGQLGNGSTIYSTTPVEVLDLEDVAVADIAAGGWHSMALTADGEIYVWGRGEYGRLGIADRTGSSKLRPHKVRGLDEHKVVQVAAGGTHSLAVTSTGRMFIWGRASYGRLGLGSGGKDCYSPVEAALPGGHERWKIAAATAGGRHTMCLAVPVRDTSQRLRDTEGASRAASVAGVSNNQRSSSSRGPSRAASAQGELGGSNGPTAAAHGSGSTGNSTRAASNGRATAATAAGGGVGNSAFGSSDSALGFEPVAAQQHQQQNRRSHESAVEAGINPAAAAATAGAAAGSAGELAAGNNKGDGGGVSGSTAATSGGSSNMTVHTSITGESSSGGTINRVSSPRYQAPAAVLPHAMTHQSSYGFAASPGSSVLGTGSPTRTNTADLAAAAAAFSPHSRGTYFQALGQGMGVEAVHAAAVAAVAAAQQLGAFRVGSPGPGSNSGGGMRQQQQSGGVSSSAGLRAGQQAPMSPRAMLPSMSPSQRRVGFDVNSTLPSYAVDDGEGSFSETTLEGQHMAVRQQMLADELLAEEDIMQQEEELEQRELDDMEEEEDTMAAAAQQQQQAEVPKHRLSRPTSRTDLAAGGSSSSRPGSAEARRPVGRPGTPAPPATAAAAAWGTWPGSSDRSESSSSAVRENRGVPTGPSVTGGTGGSMRRTGSYQGMSSLGSRQQNPSPLQQRHSPDAGVLHTLAGLGSSSGGGLQQQLGEALISGGLTRKQTQQIQAAIASSYSRVDASRQASAASLPSLSAGIGVSSRSGPTVTRIDSDLSHSGLGGSPDDAILDGGSPTASSEGGRGRSDDEREPSGVSPVGSGRGESPAAIDGDAGRHGVTGTSPPGGVYDVRLGEAGARYGSFPDREFIHRNTHVG